MKVTLITGRTTDQGKSLELGKSSEEYLKSVATIEMNEDDMKEIGTKEGEAVEVSSKFGSTVVRCKKSKLSRGTVFMPYGPWANFLVGADTQGTGMPDSKGIELEISATKKSVPTIPKMIKLMKGS